MGSKRSPSKFSYFSPTKISIDCWNTAQTNPTRVHQQAIYTAWRVMEVAGIILPILHPFPAPRLCVFACVSPSALIRVHPWLPLPRSLSSGLAGFRYTAALNYINKASLAYNRSVRLWLACRITHSMKKSGISPNWDTPEEVNGKFLNRIPSSVILQNMTQ